MSAQRPKPGGAVDDGAGTLEVQAALQAVAEATSTTLGGDYFPSVVEQLAAASDVRCALIAVLTEEASSLRTVAVWNTAEITENFTYEMAGTPCANVVDRSTCVYPSGIQERFPEDKMLVELEAKSYLGTPLYSSSGKALGLLAVVDDKPLAPERADLARTLLEVVANRVAAELDRQDVEDALRASERRYRLLFEDSQDALFMSRADGTIDDANRAAVELFGFSSKEELLGTNARDLYREPEDRERVFARLRERGFVKNHEGLFTTREGREIVALETATAVHDENDRFVGYRGMLRDVTRQRALERHLRRSQKAEAVGKLAGGVAHDYNNLLTAIQGYTELCLLEVEADSPLCEHLHEIQQAGERAAVLTQHLLALSRQQALRSQTFDLSSLVADCEEVIRSTVGEDVSLEVRLEPSPWTVEADSSQLQQLVMTLVDNAREATDPGGRIVVATDNVSLAAGDIEHEVPSQPGPYALLSIRDTGHGMDRETLDRIFEPFFTTRDDGQGTGLGLAAVYGIVEQNGGHIAVDSEPGEGTTVRVYLPRAGEEPAPAGPRPGSEPADASPRTILLAEDNEMVRALVSRVLKRAGHRVLVAEGPIQALKMSTEFEDAIDLLLTDLIMPGMTGLDLAERVVAERPETRVLVMSGYSKKGRFDAGRLPSNVGFLQKPFTPEALEQWVASMLENDRPSTPADGES